MGCHGKSFPALLAELRDPAVAAVVLMASLIVFGIGYLVVTTYRDGIPERVYLTSVHKEAQAYTKEAQVEAKAVTDAQLMDFGRAACVDLAQHGSEGFQVGVGRMINTGSNEWLSYTVYKSASTYLCPPSRFAQ